MNIMEKLQQWVCKRVSDPEIEELRKLQKTPKTCLVGIGNNAHLDLLGYHGALDSINALRYGWGIRVYFEVDRTSGAILSARAVPFERTTKRG